MGSNGSQNEPVSKVVGLGWQPAMQAFAYVGAKLALISEKEELSVVFPVDLVGL